MRERAVGRWEGQWPQPQTHKSQSRKLSPWPLQATLGPGAHVRGLTSGWRDVAAPAPVLQTRDCLARPGLAGSRGQLSRGKE